MRLLSETKEMDKPKIIIAENVKGIIPILANHRRRICKTRLQALLHFI